MRQALAIFILTLFCFSCKDHGSKPVTENPKTAETKDSASVLGNQPTRAQYVERAHIDATDYSVSLASKYFFPVNQSTISDSDKYFQTDYLFFTNKKNKDTDTLQLAVLYPTPFIIRDLTDSLQFPWPLFQVVTHSEGEIYDDQFIEYESGVLKVAFHLSDQDSTGIHLKRKDERTLSGIIGFNDEVFYWYEKDYPFTIDLSTFDFTRSIPDIQYIGLHTVATQSFKAHMLINGRVDEKLFDVNKADSVIVDTLYRSLQKVRLRVANGVQLEIKIETAKNKIQKIMYG